MPSHHHDIVPGWIVFHAPCHKVLEIARLLHVHTGAEIMGDRRCIDIGGRIFIPQRLKYCLELLAPFLHLGIEGLLEKLHVSQFFSSFKGSFRFLGHALALVDLAQHKVNQGIIGVLPRYVKPVTECN